ncbi:hypothetical protein HSX37_04590|nr:hypothetical protein [Dendrosporobacter quercicolus]NSL47322.1 hypothetical protein [Dendrosporobacter quercicolus DSM 1736]
MSDQRVLEWNCLQGAWLKFMQTLSSWGLPATGNIVIQALPIAVGAFDEE